MDEYSTLVKLLSGGKVTVPIEVRELLHLAEGDLLEIKIKKIEK